MIFIDTSFLVSFAIDTDSNHIRALSVRINSLKAQHTSEDIVKEALTVISQRKGKQFCIEFFAEISQNLTILPVNTDHFQAGLDLFLQPKLPKDISLIDCISVALCRELNIKKILSFDSHFRSLGLRPLP